MKLTFLKPNKDQQHLTDEVIHSQTDIKRQLLEATIAAVEGQWDIVDDRVESARLLLRHVRNGLKREN